MEYQSLQIIGSRTSGGAERFYSRLAMGLHARASHVLAVNPQDSAVAKEIGTNVPQQHIRMRNVWDPLARWQLQSLIRRSAAPIVQTYMGRATRLVHLPKQGPSTHVARLGGFYDVKGYHHAHAWIGNTLGICDHLVQAGLPSERVFHISNFVETDTERPSDRASLEAEHNIPADTALLLFVGRLHPNKGVADLLQAMHTLAARPADRRTHLIIVGDGPLRDALHAQAESLQLSESITWTGWVDDPARYYASADLFVCPSVHEPLGNVVLEAWAHALPVVATRSQGPVEIAEHEHDALLVDIGDTQAMADAIGALLAHQSNAAATLAANGLQKLQVRYSADVIVDEYQALYASL